MGRKSAEDVIFALAILEFLEPLFNTVHLQLFAYHMAILLRRNCNEDRLRNLAKSVMAA